MNRKQLAEAQSRGNNAQKLLDDPTLIEAFESLEASLTDDWKSTQPQDIEKREDAYRMMKAARLLRARLKNFVGKGKDATRKLNQEVK